MLEHLPGRINDRSPGFRGRDELGMRGFSQNRLVDDILNHNLETLLASGDSKDWVKISDMFLGPAPDTWTFTPKHKSNAYENGTIVGQG